MKNQGNTKNSKNGMKQSSASRGNSKRNSRSRNKAYQKERDFNEKETSQYSNDPAWYASDPTLARDAASIPFSWATGTTTNLHFVGIPDTKDAIKSFTAPGALIEWLRPSLGKSDAPTSPINVAATSIYSYVRHANSGHSNYDVSDLTMYLVAIGEIIAYTNFLIRAYGTASLVSSRNRYLPKILLRAQKIDADDLCANLAQFRYDINLAMNKLSSFAVPANFTYFKRKAFLFSGIYTEGTSAKDQLYLYAPAGFYEIDYDSDYATALSYVPYRESKVDKDKLYTTKELAQRLNDMIDKLIMSEDLNIMSGDILKAYGEGGILKFGRVDPEFTMGLTFDIGVLEQMKNATILPEYELKDTAYKACIHQGTTKSYIISTDNTVTFDSTTTATGYEKVLAQAAYSDRILTTSTADVSPELVLESTRLMVPVIFDDSTTTKTATAYSGTEIAIDAVIVKTEPSTDSEDDYILTSFRTFEWIERSTTEAYSSSSVGFSEDQMRIIEALPAFKFAPNIFYVYGTKSVTGGGAFVTWSPERVYKCVSFDNYAVLTADTLWRMHEACLLNMTRVPSIGSIYTA